jgi:hypothetical protein
MSTRIERGLARTISSARAVARRTLRTLRADHTLAAYTNQKFPGLSRDEVNAVVRCIGEVRNAPSPQVSDLPSMPSCFVLSPTP